MPLGHLDGEDLFVVSDVHPWPVTSSLPLSRADYTSAANEISAVVKASSGILKHLSGSSTENAFLHFFDATSVPANGAVPKLRVNITANDNLSTDIVPDIGMRFGTGIVFAVSTTKDTLTVSLTNSVVLTVSYE